MCCTVPHFNAVFYCVQVVNRANLCLGTHFNTEKCLSVKSSKVSSQHLTRRASQAGLHLALIRLLGVTALHWNKFQCPVTPSFYMCHCLTKSLCQSAIQSPIVFFFNGRITWEMKHLGRCFGIFPNNTNMKLNINNFSGFWSIFSVWENSYQATY